MIDQYPSQNGVLTSLIWRKTMSGGETSLSGYDNASQALSYTPGQEQVYLNGILLVRGDDYTATNGTSITGLSALSASDFVQVNCYNNFSVATLPTSGLTGTISNAQLQNSAITINGTSVALGGSYTVAGDIESVTAGTGLSGGGNSGAVTVSLDTTSQYVVPSQSTHSGKYLTTDGTTSSWETVDLSAKTDKSTLTTTGDIYYASSANTPDRLAIGSTGQVLTVANGLPSWATPSAGGGSGSLTLLQTLSLGSTGVNSSTISSAYTNLLIIITGVTATGNLDCFMRFNNDTGNSYQLRGVYTDTAAGSMNGGLRDNVLAIASVGSGVTSDSIHRIYRYSSTGRRLIDQNLGGGISGPTYRYQNNIGLYSSNSAISSIQFSRVQVDHTFTGGTIYIYGEI